VASRGVAVTGLGLMTGLGLDLESSWEGLVAGRSPIGQFKLFDPEGLACRYGVELPAGVDELFRERIKTQHRRKMARGTRMAVVTAQQAIADAGLDLAALDRSRVGVVLGSTGTGYHWSGPEADDQRIIRNMSNAPAFWIAYMMRVSGPSFVVGTACSSGAYALGSAVALIEGGQCDVVVAGAADSSLNYADVEGFCSIMALAEQQEDIASASRPFDRKRSGFVIGEGGGMMVVESPEFARARGARVYARTHAPGLTSESYNVVSPRPDGVGMAETMRAAIGLAGLEPDQIDYVNAHGTSTHLNDAYETAAIKRVFGERAPDLPVSSTKSMTGHCLAAAAGVESVICCKAVEQGVIPPTANLTEPDPDLGLDFVPLKARRATLAHVLCNSFAFGGHNGVCVFSRTA